MSNTMTGIMIIIATVGLILPGQQQANRLEAFEKRLDRIEARLDTLIPKPPENIHGR